MRFIAWIRDFITWNLVPSGVVCVGRTPTANEYAGWVGIRKANLYSGQCTVCDREFWSWRDRSVCSSFGCYRSWKQSERCR